ncbi:sigma-70 family RNA polymerase sigma factor [Puia sp. P3]|uniref:sigma-70 family RNA polymerase sigma factor n=1 Tax=Puia sp. P3 TaxID=3423952 RepID=UPI003D67EAAF
MRGEKSATNILAFAFKEAWDYRSFFEDEDQLVFFLYFVAAAKMTQLRRRAERRYIQLTAAFAVDAQSEEDRSVLIRRIIAAVDKLPRQRKMAIREHYLNGKTARQIADEQQLSERTVYNHMSRGLDDLKKSLPLQTNV